ncbi:MAG TPA: CPBP family intramembrane glutamic endopeptidase [Thermoanaerobaculia bacterium]|nr:CPBP family intramembrane glutamic endopeptidase [Thermoanaerobaculia bacterium]
MIVEAGAPRLLLALLLAVATALAVDRWTAARGFEPPGFERPWRRAAALAVLVSIFFVAVFLPMALFGLERAPLSPDDVTTPRLFLLQGLLVLALVLWFLLGFAGTAPRALAGADPSAEPGTAPEAELGTGPETAPRIGEGLAATFARQLGLASERPLVELGIGLGAGVAGWLLVILLMLAVMALVWALGGEELLPTEPPELVPWVAGLPLATRAAIALTAGVVEELFFRGLLQPRVGIALSSALFVLAHLSYEQPFMLIGIAALSLVFAWLVAWRRTILPAIAAHAAFDLIQLLIVVPQVLKRLPEVAG